MIAAAARLRRLLARRRCAICGIRLDTDDTYCWEHTTVERIQHEEARRR